MKKILLIGLIFITSCSNTSSSSVDSANSSTTFTTATSSFNSSVFFEEVRNITISAASDSLLQTVENIRPVTVTATTNQGVSPDLSYEWFVNGVKSNQFARIFEFTPPSTGNYDIQVLVNRVASNTLRIQVNKPTIAIDAIEFLSNRVLEVRADSGLSFSSNDLEIANYVFYPQLNVYNIELEKSLQQGTTAIININKNGYNQAVRTLTFDTRKVEVKEVFINKELTNITGTSFDLEKPHTLNVNGTKVGPSTFTEIDISFKTTNIVGDNVNYIFENSSRPSGALTIPSFLGAADINNNQEIVFNFKANLSTISGSYGFRIRVGQTSLNLIIRVKDALPNIELSKFIVDDESFNMVVFDAVKSSPSVLSAASGVKAIDEIFTLSKDTLDYKFKEISFSFTAKNFNVPDNLLDFTQANPNQIIVNLLGPNDSQIIRTTSLSQLNFPPITLIRGFSSLINVRQRIDSSTISGSYKFIIRVLEAGTEVYRKEINLEFLDPTPKLTFSSTLSDENKGSVPTIISIDSLLPDQLYLEIEKPSRVGLDSKILKVNTIISDFESSINQNLAPANTYLGKNNLGDGQVVRELLVFKKSYIGPSTINPAVVNTKDSLVALELGIDISTTDYVSFNQDGEKVVRSRLSSDTSLFNFYRATNSNQVEIEDTFIFEINHTTTPGIYTFSITIGKISQSFKVNVMPANPRIDLTLSTNNKYQFDQVSNTYSINLDNSNEAEITFDLVILNTQLPANNQLLLRVETYDNDGIGNISSLNYQVFEKAGNDGHLLSPVLVNRLHNGESTLIFSKVGMYRFIVANNQFSTEVIVEIRPYPTLEIVQLLFDEAAAIRYFDGNYMINTDKSNLKLGLSVAPINLSDSVYYKIYANIVEFSSSLGENNLILMDFSNKKTGKIEYMIENVSFDDNNLIARQFFVALYHKNIENEEQFDLFGHKEVIIYLTNFS